MENSDDPINPGIFKDYGSRNICTFGYELTENRIEFYKHNENGRFIASQVVEKDSATSYQKLVEFIYSKKHNGHFKDSNFVTTSTYCGPTFIACIKSGDRVSRKRIAESLKNQIFEARLLSYEYAAFIDTMAVYQNLPWQKLKNQEFPNFIIEAEQFANLNTYLPPPPPHLGSKFSPPKVQK